MNTRDITLGNPISSMAFSHWITLSVCLKCRPVAWKKHKSIRHWGKHHINSSCESPVRLHNVPSLRHYPHTPVSESILSCLSLTNCPENLTHLRLGSRAWPATGGSGQVIDPAAWATPSNTATMCISWESVWWDSVHTTTQVSAVSKQSPKWDTGYRWRFPEYT